MKFYTLKEATDKNLVRLTQWLNDIPDERSYLEDAHKQVSLSPERVTMFVKNGDLIALFVDKTSETMKSGKAVRGPSVRLSKSKRYKSIRHLAEILFANNPNITLEDFRDAMKREYPKSATAGIKCYGHYCWYRHHLKMQGRFRCIPRPKSFNTGQL